jgi:hypothetical protein
MKIGTANSQAQAQSRPVAQTEQFNLRNAWLRELERAQLEWWAMSHPVPNPRAVELRDPDRPTGTVSAGAASSAAALDRSGSAALAGARQTRVSPSRAPESNAALGHRERNEGASAASESPSDALEEPGSASGELVRENRSAAVDPLFAPSRVPEMGIVPDRPGDFDLRAAPAIDPAEKGPDASPLAGTAPPLRDRQWPARSVHMMLDRSGARVWIRDGNVAQGGAGSILSSLSAELALRGLRLRTLTLNGRVAFDAEPASDADRSGKKQAAASSERARPGTTSSLHSTFSDEVNRYGND